MEKLIGELYSWNNFFDTVQLRGNEKRKAALELHKTVNNLIKELTDQRNNDIEEFTKHSFIIVGLVERIILDKIDSKIALADLDKLV